ncbi:MAG: RNA methyltransferase [Flavobacterium sp.]|nr:MAG: RNA methyltransferase [Flavobacterium sp.]
MISEDNLMKELISLDWDFSDSKTESLHSIHPYPAKFIPEIPRCLIQNLPIPSNTIILDPFCGSGVTLVESQRAGIESIGIDLNPIATLLSTVKTQELSPQFLEIALKVFSKCATYKKGVIIPPIPNLDHWFKKSVQEGITILLTEINKIKDERIANALRFCVSSIIVRVSNQESDTRYAAVENHLERNDVFSLFKLSAEKLWNAKMHNQLEVPSRIINKDSLQLTKADIGKKVGLVITSPPYPNAYEYWLYHKYRMWWLGFDPLEVKESEIGARAHYFKKNHQTADDFIIQMEKLLRSLASLCAKGAFVCFVIGQSKIHGEIIENEKIIANAALKGGLTHIATIKRMIRSGRKSFNLSHARIKEEFIVILQKQ